MQFPEVQLWATNIVALFQIIGGAIAAICICVIATILLTSMGNEHKMTIVKTAGVTLVIGLALLAGADKISALMQTISAAMQ